jgi:hypothetical protein
MDSPTFYVLNDTLAAWAQDEGCFDNLDADEIDRRLNDATHAAARILRGEG